MDSHTLIETLAINVLAALLGLSLPLIMQIIDRLDSKYGSAVISTSFRKEREYSAYYYMVWVTIALVLYLPWVQPPLKCLPDCWLINNSAHILVGVCLTTTLFCLFIVSRKITIYDIPERLLSTVAGSAQPTNTDVEKSEHKIDKLINNPDKFAIFSALLKYSMTVGNIPLYLKCNTIFGFCIGSYYSKAKEGEEIVFSDLIYNLINETIRISQRFYDKLLYPSLNSPYISLTAYYNSYGKTVVSDKSFSQLWQNLVQLIGCNKPEWFKGYWVYASQYADYTVSDRSWIPNDLIDYFYNKKSVTQERLAKIQEDHQDLLMKESYVNERRRLCETHHMILAYLMYIGKTDIVDWCFVYSPSSLNTQLLIPKRINDIIDEFRRIEKNMSAPLDFRYPFYQENGIRSAEIIENALIRFYIYAIYQQWKRFQNGLSSIDPWNEIEIHEENISKRAHEISYTIHLLDIIRERLYPNIDYFLSLGVLESDINEINKKLENIQNLLRNKLNELEKDVVINHKDEEKANSILHTAAKEGKIIDGINKSLPQSTETNPIQKMEITKKVGVSISKSDYIWNTENLFESITPTIISQMNIIAQQAYLRLFLLNSARARFFVNYDEIRNALDRLGIFNQTQIFAVIPVGIVPDSSIEKYCEPAFMRGTRTEVIIVQRKFLPAAIIKNTSDLTSKFENNNKIIFFGADLELQLIYNEKISYIRLVIINSLVDGRLSQLKQIESIETYMHIEE